MRPMRPMACDIRRFLYLLLGSLIILYMATTGSVVVVVVFQSNNNGPTAWQADRKLALEAALVVAAPLQRQLSIDAATTATTVSQPKQRLLRQQQQQQPTYDESSSSCAILLYGLPRSFASLVLDSLVHNVVQQNPSCDYYVHLYRQDVEPSGRAGAGGEIRPDEMYLLQHYVSSSSVAYAETTEEEFYAARGSLLHKIDTVTDPIGMPLYFPWRDSSYIRPHSTTNIIKMWHSIDAVWQLMEASGKQYDTVGMFRSDAVFATPIDLYEYPDRIVVPSFGRHPISDRCAYGPAAAMKIWATERFNRLEEHVAFMYEHEWGYGLHSERFVHHALFPAMRQVLAASRKKNSKTRSHYYHHHHQDDDSVPTDRQWWWNRYGWTKDGNLFSNDLIVEHPTMCFYRARADETVWASDCTDQQHQDLNAPDVLQPRVEALLGRPCAGVVGAPRTKIGLIVLHCPQNNDFHTVTSLNLLGH